MALPPYPFRPYNKLDYLEFLSEQHQNDDRDGFVNMGANDSFTHSGSADQSVNGQEGADNIELVGSSDDTVFGGSGNDNIEAGGGSDIINGGSGIDTIFGGAGADRISGGSGSDFLNGDNDSVEFSQHGADRISGGSGDDTIYGAGGADILTGGTDDDKFVFQVGLGAENESKVGAADHITDFEVGDHIDVSAIDADGNAANGNSQFTFSASGASTQAGKFWFEQHDDGQHVFFNINGGAADMEIILDNNHQFTTADFLL